MKFGRDRSKPASGAGSVSFGDESEGAPATAGVEAEGVAAPAHEETAQEGAEAQAETAVGPASDEPAPASAEAAVEDVPAKSRFGFGRSKAPSEPKPVKVKSVKVKAVKEPKAPRERASKVKAVSVDDISLPLTVIIAFYQGVKEREAEQIARSTIEKNFDAPNASFVYTQPWRDGVAVEMQEGGGLAYLPEVLAKIDEDGDTRIALAMSNRMAEVYLDPDTASLTTYLLPANTEPGEGTFPALPTTKMRPYDRRGSKVFIAGLALLGASLIATLASSAAFFVDTKAWAAPYMVQTRVNDLPAAQGDKIKRALEGADCVLKMSYDSGAGWTVLPGWDKGGTCSGDKLGAQTAQANAVADAAVAAATAANGGPSMAPGAPGTNPGMAPGAPGMAPGAVPPPGVSPATAAGVQGMNGPAAGSYGPPQGMGPGGPPSASTSVVPGVGSASLALPPSVTRH